MVNHNSSSYLNDGHSENIQTKVQEFIPSFESRRNETKEIYEVIDKDLNDVKEFMHRLDRQNERASITIADIGKTELAECINCISPQNIEVSLTLIKHYNIIPLIK